MKRLMPIRRTASSSWTCYRWKRQDKMVVSTGSRWLGVVTAQNPTITTVRYAIRQYCKAIESPRSDNARVLVNKPWTNAKFYTTEMKLSTFHRSRCPRPGQMTRPSFPGFLYSKSYVFSQNYGAVQIEATLSYNIPVSKIETLRPLRLSA